MNNSSGNDPSLTLSDFNFDYINSLLNKEDDDYDYDSDSSMGSTQSLPEQRDLHDVVLSRYTRYHPKDLIPAPEKLLVLYLTEFNELFGDLEESFQETEHTLTKEINEMQVKNKKKNREKIKRNKLKLKESRNTFLKQKSRLEKFYAHICIKAIEEHPMPSSQLHSILNLLKTNSGTLQSICLHLEQFSYIDSDLDSDDDEDGDYQSDVDSELSSDYGSD